MPAGASPKREREYRELRQKLRSSGRYRGREEEVAARIVNKQRAQYGETREQQRMEKEGRSPDRGLPLAGYQHMTIAQVRQHLGELSAADIRKLRTHEMKNKNRVGLLRLFDRCLERH